MAAQNPLASSLSPSKARVNGIDYNINAADFDYYWRWELCRTMKEIEPRFVIDDRNRILLLEIFRWVWRRNGVTSVNCALDPSKGLLLCGPLGVGKSVLLRGLQRYEGKINRMCFGFNNDNLGFKFTSAAEIALLYAEKGMEGISKFTDRERMCNLAIDEIGREATDSKHFGTGINVVQTILQLRYEHRREFITHGTTNLDPNIQFSDTYGDYIADRVKELFNVIEIKGDTRR